MRTVRLVISVAATSLVVASMIHLEVLTPGYRHQQAGIAEAAIGASMLVGLGLTWLSARRQQLIDAGNKVIHDGSWRVIDSTLAAEACVIVSEE